ncbi:MAG: TonB-dependent receptor, partial [Asticcacaulis sp. 32-58-5]
MQMISKRALIMAGVAFSAIVSSATAMSALAQDAPVDTVVDDMVQEVVVTGTRIRRPNLKSASPITSIDNAEVQLQGAIATDKFLATLPQIEAGANENLSNGSTGRATINLRSLGTNRGLVLIDGQRILPAQATDLNFVPSTLVQRTDVLTGGASSVYGSDAMSGVVNFILLKNLEGVKVDAQYSIYNHKNDDKYLRSIQSARGFELADEDVWDGRKTDFNIAAGANFEDGKGNLTGYFGYRKMDGVTQANRDYSNCALTYPNSAATTYACGGSSTHGYGSFRPLTDPNGNQILPAQTYANAKDGSRTWVIPDSSFDYNYSPANYIQRNSERYTGGAFLNYKFNDHAEAYGSFMYMDDHSKSQVAPSGIWTGRGFKVNCNNPLMSDQQRTILCGSAAAADFETTDQATTWVALRAVAGEPRRNDMRHTNFRTVFGMRGEIVDGWNYDVSYLYASARNRANYQNDISQDKVEQALNAIEVNGVLQCVNTSGGCQPIDVFSANGPSAEGFAFIYAPT